MSSKKSTFVCKYGLKRGSRHRQLLEARKKRNSEGGIRVEPTSVDAKQQPASVFKLEKNEEILQSHNILQRNIENCSSKFLLVDVNLLSGLVSCLRCTLCEASELHITEGKNDFGLASELILKCKNCNSELSSVCSSQKISDKANSPFEITNRFVTAMIDMGVGYAGMEKFCTAMGMECLHHKTFNKYAKTIQASTNKVSEDTLEYASSIVRDVYCQTTNCNKDDIIDIAVSYDGSWMKRGHTSNFGVGIAIDLLTGLVLDYQVMSKYCHSCALLTEDFKKTAAYEEWKTNHICDKNFDGTSGSMEMIAARMIWERSVEKHKFRYRTVLSDGDSKTYIHLTEPQVYGNDFPIDKEECINHVSKRMGAALRKLAAESRSHGVLLGGRGHGKLKAQSVD